MNGTLQCISADHSGTNQVPISQFLKTDMTNKVIVAMALPSMTDDYVVRMYKVAQRAEVGAVHIYYGA
jgi:hypothetical protein